MKGNIKNSFQPNSKNMKPALNSGLKDYFTEYCNNTSLHGIQYIGEKKRTRCEKLWWCFLFLTAVVCCSFLIMKTYKKWQNAPVLVSFSQSTTPVWNIPFPSVTICPEVKIRQSYYNYTDLALRKISNELTKEELHIFNKLSLVCNQKGSNGNDTVEDTVLDFLADVAPKFHEMFSFCSWDDVRTECKDLFKPTLNDQGICYTFNRLPSDQMFADDLFVYGNSSRLEKSKAKWSVEEGFPEDAGLDELPKRSASAGAQTGLHLFLRTIIQDLDYACKTSVQGYKIILHQPGEISRGSLQYILAPLDQEVIVSVTPDIMATSVGLRDYSPEQRKCYFQGEMTLRYFQMYTQQNCEVECLANATLEVCKCVAYHMPRIHTTPICGVGKFSCMRKVQVRLSTNVVTNPDLILNTTKNFRKECNCLPACFSLKYFAEISQADLEWKKRFVYLEKATKLKFREFLETSHYTSVFIFFKDLQFMSTERHELYGSTDFLANCGGIFGLFTGFSLLSFLEIIYYLTIRPLVNKWKFGGYFTTASDVTNVENPLEDIC